MNGTQGEKERKKTKNTMMKMRLDFMKVNTEGQHKQNKMKRNEKGTIIYVERVKGSGEPRELRDKYDSIGEQKTDEKSVSEERKEGQAASRRG